MPTRVFSVKLSTSKDHSKSNTATFPFLSLLANKAYSVLLWPRVVQFPSTLSDMRDLFCDFKDSFSFGLCQIANMTQLSAWVWTWDRHLKGPDPQTRYHFDLTFVDFFVRRLDVNFTFVTLWLGKDVRALLLSFWSLLWRIFFMRYSTQREALNCICCVRSVKY